MPLKLRAVHKYFVQNQTLDPPTGGLCIARVYRANGMYDPEVAVGGHQPRGFDQLAAFYNKYLVIKARITVDFNVPSGVPNRMVLGVAVRDNSTTFSNGADYIEQGAKYKSVGEGQVDGMPRRISVVVNPNKYNGVSKPLSNTASNGTTGSDPTNGVYFHVFAFDTGAGNPGVIQSVVKITYFAVWHDPGNIPIS